MIITIRDDLTSHVITDDGLLECALPDYHPETLVKFASSQEVQEFAATLGSNPNYWRPVPTPEQIAANEAAAAAAQAVAYKAQRAAEYPSIADQLDVLFHDGLDGWKATIQAVKDKYPKAQ